MPVVTITLQLAEDADPPTAAMSVQIDTDPAINKRIGVRDWLAVVDVAAAAVGEDLRATVLPALTAATDALRDRIEREQAAQEARQSALDEWTSATGSPLAAARAQVATPAQAVAEPAKAEPATQRRAR